MGDTQPFAESEPDEALRNVALFLSDAFVSGRFTPDVARIVALKRNALPKYILDHIQRGEPSDCSAIESFIKHHNADWVCPGPEWWPCMVQRVGDAIQAQDLGSRKGAAHRKATAQHNLEKVSAAMRENPRKKSSVLWIVTKTGLDEKTVRKILRSIPNAT
jgi:hypothetical protein